MKLHTKGADALSIQDVERWRVKDLLNNFNRLVFEFRGHCGYITNWLAMPEPFPYYHGVCFACYMYLLILSYGFTTLRYPAVLTFLSFLVMNTCIMGLKEVCHGRRNGTVTVLKHSS